MKDIYKELIKNFLGWLCSIIIGLIVSIILDLSFNDIITVIVVEIMASFPLFAIISKFLHDWDHDPYAFFITFLFLAEFLTIGIIAIILDSLFVPGHLSYYPIGWAPREILHQYAVIYSLYFYDRLIFVISLIFLLVLYLKSKRSERVSKPSIYLI